VTVDLTAGTTIYFTDTNVLQTRPPACSPPRPKASGPGPPAPVAAGTSVALLGTGVSGQYAARSGAAGGTPNGTVANLNGSASNLSSGGDILYAFQAASYATNYQPGAITFLGAISNRGSYTVGQPRGDRPAGIQVREYKIDANTATRYTQFSAQVSTDDTPFTTLDELRAALAQGGNWTTVAASNSLPIVSDVLVSPVPEPAQQADAGRPGPAGSVDSGAALSGNAPAAAPGCRRSPAAPARRPRPSAAGRVGG
jgi:hypothetical protein